MHKSVLPPSFFTALSRRQFLSATGVTVAGGLLLSSPAMAKEEAAPRAGGILRMAFADGPDTLDPQATASFVGRQLNNLVYDTLTRLDAEQVPQPALATRWWPEKDGIEWVFELRQGVRFHHGRLLTSADVVATLNRLDDVALGLGGMGSFGPVVEVRAEGDHRVRIVYRQPFGEAPITAAGDWSGILPADRLNNIRNQPCGTGPFRFKGFQPGSSVSLEKNPGYWREGRPYLDGIELRVIRESVAQQGALLAGEIDLVSMISPEAYLSIRNKEQVRAYSVENGNHHAIILQADRPPFDNPEVRRGFRYLLNRDALLATALLGQGRIGNDTPIPPGSSYALPASAHQDLALARRLIQQSGAGPLKLDLWTSSERPPAPKLALALAQSAAQIGITLTVRDTPYTDYVARVARKQSLYTSYQGALPTLYQSLHRTYHSAGAANYGKREQFPGCDALLDEVIAEVDAGKRQVLASQLLEKLSLYSERLIPYFQNYMAATSLRVQGFVPPTYMIIDFRDIWLSA